MYFIGVGIIIAGAVLFSVFKGVTLALFINPPVFIFFFFIVVGIIVATSGYRTFVRGLNAIISPNYSISEEECRNAAGLYRLLSKSILLASFVALIVGILAILMNLSDVEHLVHAAAAGLVGPMSGIILAFVFFEPAVYILQRPRQKISAVETMDYSPDLVERLLEMCIQNGLSPEDIKNATGIELRKD